MALQEWSNPELTEVYSQKAANPEVNWFEYEVNLPAMLSLISENARTVLDFGSGAGDVTKMLADKFELVEGCDPSPTMLELSHRDFPELKFFEWDATSPIENKADYYDVVFSKLAVHFVEDLSPVAQQLFVALKKGGSLVFSVPHPMSTARKTHGASYWEQTPYPTEIGSYGISVTMIHRSIQDYVTPFIEAGFVLTAFNEPRVSAEIAQAYGATESDTATPKRINLRFSKMA
jgi:trans-aconitate methyltransferase